MRNLFSKGLMAAAAVMMFASCSNEEGFVNPNEGKTSEVTVAMSINGTKADAGEVNMDGTVSAIQNVVVVPMVGDAYQTPIVFGQVTPVAGKPETRTKTLPQTVNHFRVYGNPTANNANENLVFTPTTLEFTTGTDVIGETGAYAPHGLYYYADFNKNFKVATGESWPADELAWSDVPANGIGQNKFVKLSGVKYAVGVLAAAIQNGDNTTVFSDTEDMGTTATWTGNEVEVSGVIVYNQTKAFNDKLEPQSEKVAVYDEVATGKGAITNATVSNTERANGNLYCVVAPAADQTVTLNIEFVAKKYFKLASGKTVAPETKLYLPVVLNKPADGGDIFSAATATFLNAKVMNWGLASETPVESTDVTIGVEFNTQWAEGLKFDVEI